VTYAADGTPKIGKAPAQPALVTYSGYKITVGNKGLTSSNTVNNVTFRAATRVASSAPLRTAPFAPPAVGIACSSSASPPADWSYTVNFITTPYTPATGSYIECPIGQLKVGDSKTFYVYFLAPKAPSPVVSETIEFDWRINYGEGTNDSGGASRTDTQQATVSVGLGTTNPTEVKSAVPSSKQVELFTGDFGIATFDDKWTTTVRIPGGNTVDTTAEIFERQVGPDCFPGFTFCVSSKLTVPLVAVSVQNPLVIILRRDASTIPNGARIRDVVTAGLKYFPDPDNLTNYELIRECRLFPLGESNGIGGITQRCISSYIEFKNNNAPTEQYVADWQLVIDALGNGEIAW
jgi:hypothetical protein